MLQMRQSVSFLSTCIKKGSQLRMARSSQALKMTLERPLAPRESIFILHALSIKSALHRHRPPIDADEVVTHLDLRKHQNQT